MTFHVNSSSCVCGPSCVCFKCLKDCLKRFMPRVEQYLKEKRIEESLVIDATGEAWVEGMKWIEEGRAAKMTSAHRQGALCIAAYRKALNLLRRKRRSFLSNAVSLESVDCEPLSRMEPFHAVSAAEEEFLIREAFVALGDDDRCLLILRYLDDETLSEIGERFGCRPSHAHWRVAKARQRLINLFSQKRLQYRRKFSFGAQSIDEGDE